MGRVAVALAGLLLAIVPAHGVDRPRLMPADGSAVIPYYIDAGQENSGFRAGDADLAMWALREWERNAAGALRFEPATRPEDASLRVRWLAWAADAALGRMEPSVEGEREVATLLIRPDESRFRPSIRRRVLADPLMRDVVVYYVCLHEIGHALGLTHSGNLRDIMWSGGTGVTLPIYDRYRKHIDERGAIARTEWLSHDDVARFRTLWRSSSSETTLRP